VGILAQAAMTMLPSCWSWRTLAAATVGVPGPGRLNFQARLHNPAGITATVAHSPTGASKLNPIEHRLFSEISKHWAAEPLVSYDKNLPRRRELRTRRGSSWRDWIASGRRRVPMRNG
jgi:hypothetical protein